MIERYDIMMRYIKFLLLIITIMLPILRQYKQLLLTMFKNDFAETISGSGDTIEPTVTPKSPIDKLSARDKGRLSGYLSVLTEAEISK